MKRKDFIRNGVIGTSGALIFPYLSEPSFPFRQNNQRNDHSVILCILGGGIRNADILNESSGFLSPFIHSTDTPMASVSLYEHMRHTDGTVSHYNAYANILTGHYQSRILKSGEKPSFPSVTALLTEEWIRKEMNIRAHTIAHPLSSYYPLGLDPFYLEKHCTVKNPTQSWNEKIVKQVIRNRKVERPQLVIFDLQGADIAHSNYRAYRQHINHLGKCLESLWMDIRVNNAWGNKTTLIVTQDLGRNATPNEITDEDGNGGLDHSCPTSAGETFCLIAGPSDSVQNRFTRISSPVQTIDILPTIGHLLGVSDSPGFCHLPGKSLKGIPPENA